MKENTINAIYLVLKSSKLSITQKQQLYRETCLFTTKGPGVPWHSLLAKSKHFNIVGRGATNDVPVKLSITFINILIDYMWMMLYDKYKRFETNASVIIAFLYLLSEAMTILCNLLEQIQQFV